MQPPKLVVFSLTLIILFIKQPCIEMVSNLLSRESMAAKVPTELYVTWCLVMNYVEFMKLLLVEFCVQKRPHLFTTETIMSNFGFILTKRQCQCSTKAVTTLAILFLLKSKNHLRMGLQPILEWLHWFQWV